LALHEPNAKTIDQPLIRLIKVMVFLAMGVGLFSKEALAQITPPRLVSPPIRELVVNATLNGQRVGEGIEVLDVNGLGILVSVADFEKFGLIGVAPRFVQRGTTQMVSLSRTPGLKAVLDLGQLELAVTADLTLFRSTRIDLSRSTTQTATAGYGGIVNYDVSAQRASAQNSMNGLGEIILFSPYGSVVTTVAGAKIQTLPSTFVRLDTVYQLDLPTMRARLRLGDSATAAGQFGGSARFGGVQFGTEEATNPRFVWQPLLNFSGTANVPSTVEIFLNANSQKRVNIPPGPFAIENLATLNSRGDARVVITDLLGREVVIEQPFFNANGQLRAGLSKYSVSAGWLRTGYGVASSAYGAAMLAGYWRYGISDRLTSELRVEGQRDGPRLASATAIFPIAHGHSVSASSAMSDAYGKRAAAFGASYSFVSDRLNYGIQWDKTQADFRLLGAFADSVPARSRILVSAGLGFGAYGSLSTGYVRSESQTHQTTQFATLNYYLPIAREWRLASGLTHNLATPRILSAYLGLSWYGGDGLSANATVRTNCNPACGAADSVDGQISVAQRASGDRGFNWQLEATRNRSRGTAEWLTEAGILSAELAAAKNGGGFGRVGARGAVLAFDGNLTVSQAVQDSFILVRAAEAPGVAIDSSVGRGVILNSQGYAILPRVSGFDPVSLTLRQESLPLNVTASSDAVTAVVRARAGAVVKLDARRVSSITFNLIGSNKKPLQSGIVVEVGGKSTPVGLDGLVYFENIQSATKGRAVQGKRSCEFNLPLPPAGDLLPHLGAITCELR
jgi:outer membrane usher protein